MLATLQSEATLACIDLSCSDPTGLPPPSGEMWGVARERRAFCWDCFVKQPPHSEPEVGAAHRQHPAPAQRLRLQSGDLAHHRLSRIPCRVERASTPREEPSTPSAALRRRMAADATETALMDELPALGD